MIPIVFEMKENCYSGEGGQADLGLNISLRSEDNGGTNCYVYNVVVSSLHPCFDPCSFCGKKKVVEEEWEQVLKILVVRSTPDSLKERLVDFTTEYFEGRLLNNSRVAGHELMYFQSDIMRGEVIRPYPHARRMIGDIVKFTMESVWLLNKVRIIEFNDKCYLEGRDEMIKEIIK